MERITLENAGYEELLERAVSQIPDLCPDWKNTRESDPGITLIQLMAALTDVQNYTVNAISEQHKEEYIRLLGGKKQGIKCAQADVNLRSGAKLIKDERIKIGNKVFEYSGNKLLFIQKETLIKSTDFYCNGTPQTFTFPFGIALNGSVRIFERFGGDKRWWPVKPNKLHITKLKDALSIEIKYPQTGRYRAVFYDEEGIRNYYEESGVAYPEDGILEFGKTSGVTMQKIEIFLPKSNSIMPRMLNLWVNYGAYYEEIGFNPIKDGFAMLGNGRDFPILNEGGKIEAFSLVLTKGATSLSKRQQVSYNGEKIGSATVTVLSEGKNAETVDEALSRINDMLVPQTCVTTNDYMKKIKELYGDGIKKLKVVNCRTSNKIIVYALLNNDKWKRFSNWKRELLKKLQPYRLLTVSLEVHKAKSVSVTVEGEIALVAGSGVEIQKEIERTVSKLCESEIGLPINSYLLTEKLLGFPQVKRINRLNMKYDREIEGVQQTLTFLNKLSINFIIS